MTAGADQSVPLELAERIGGFLYPFRDDGAPRSRVFVGTVPPGLPFDLPLPPGATLLGSRLGKSRLSFHEAGRGVRAEEDEACIYLDAPGDADTIFAFYDTAMRALDWAPPPAHEPVVRPRESHAGSQLPRFDYAPSRYYCAGPHGPWLMVTAHEQPPGPSDVRIFVNLSDTSLCAPPRKNMFDPPRVLGVLPELTLPRGARFSGGHGGGGGNDDEWVVNAIAETSLSTTDLERHYARQLADAGWVRRDGGANGPLVWSTWRSPPPSTWDALFWVVEEPPPNQRFLHLRVQRRGLLQAIGRLVAAPP